MNVLWIKKGTVILLAIALGFVLLSESLFAQSDEGNWNVEIIRLETVFRNPLGYKVVFKQPDFTRSECYLPFEWFNRSRNRLAQLVYTNSLGTPSMHVFYQNGEFDRLLLQLPDNPHHETFRSMADPEEEKRLLSQTIFECNRHYSE